MTIKAGTRSPIQFARVPIPELEFRNLRESVRVVRINPNSAPFCAIMFEAGATNNRLEKIAVAASDVIASGTADGLMAFLDFIIDRGIVPPSTATPWKSASKQV